MTPRTIERLLGLIEEIGVALTRRDLPGGRRALAAMMRMLLSEYDEVRRRQS